MRIPSRSPEDDIAAYVGTLPNGETIAAADGVPPTARSGSKLPRTTGLRSQSARAGRLVVVSNRVLDPDRSNQAGGLAVALDDAFRTEGGLWFGWSGKIGKEAVIEPTKHRKVGNVDLFTVDMTATEYQDCYLGYANRCLWPILHYRTDLVEFQKGYIEAYQALNRRFAEILGTQLRHDDVIWVHDYHLIPLARILRRLGHCQRIGFFLHVPFPPKEVFAALPGYEAILRDLAAYDLIGFQTKGDVSCFVGCIEGLAGGRSIDSDIVEISGHRVRVGAFPVGINVGDFAELAASPKSRPHVERLLGALQERALIIGVDRLDYTKGLPDRFAAYRRLLEDYPDWQNKVSLLQIAPLSRQELGPYTHTREELHRLCGEINGQFADFDWTPIRCHLKPIARSTLAGLYRASRVGIVTPLRDGMNLVAKEFVAAQDPDDPGVLVLSRFAGAAETMKEALIVNPHDVDGTAAALNEALTMSRDERVARHEALVQRLHEQNSRAWQRSFLDQLVSQNLGTRDKGKNEVTMSARAPAFAEGGQTVRDRDRQLPPSDYIAEEG